MLTLPQIPPKEKQEGKSELFVGLARLWCGTLRKGMKIHVLGPRYNPANPNEYRTEMEARSLSLSL